MLRMLSSKPELPWCCVGDFNELLQVQDKRGGAPCAHSLMQASQDTLDCCRFVNLGIQARSLHGMGAEVGIDLGETRSRGSKL